MLEKIGKQPDDNKSSSANIKELGKNSIFNKSVSQALKGRSKEEQAVALKYMQSVQEQYARLLAQAAQKQQAPQGQQQQQPQIQGRQQSQSMSSQGASQSQGGGEQSFARMLTDGARTENGSWMPSAFKPQNGPWTTSYMHGAIAGVAPPSTPQESAAAGQTMPGGSPPSWFGTMPSNMGDALFSAMMETAGMEMPKIAMTKAEYNAQNSPNAPAAWNTYPGSDGQSQGLAQAAQNSSIPDSGQMNQVDMPPSGDYSRGY